jgi:hypothetical protein
MTAIADALDCRFLCASVCSYAIQANGSFDSADCEPYYDTVGWQSTPVAFATGLATIDACLVGTIQASTSLAGPAVLLAFRGTLPPTDPPTIREFLDWLNDFDGVPMSAPGITGMVHSGFWGSLMELWPSAWAEVQKQMSAGGQTLPLYITGHSKGGALASLAAAQCAEVEQVTPTAVYTYASPMTGDNNFAVAYNGLGFPDIRYEYTDDLVPHLPPSPIIADLFAPIPVIGPYFQTVAKWDYNSVGTLQFIDWSGNIVGDSLSLAWKRFVSLFELMAEFDFSQIGADHKAACPVKGEGYMTQICTSGVCLPQAAPADPLEEIPGERPIQRWRRERARHLSPRATDSK